MTDTDRSVARAMSRLHLRLAEVRRRAGAPRAVVDRHLASAVAWTLYRHGLGPDPGTIVAP
jgi:hypothetical protein